MISVTIWYCHNKVIKYINIVAFHMGHRPICQNWQKNFKYGNNSLFWLVISKIILLSSSNSTLSMDINCLLKHQPITASFLLLVKKNGVKTWFYLNSISYLNTGPWFCGGQNWLRIIEQIPCYNVTLGLNEWMGGWIGGWITVMDGWVDGCRADEWMN